MDLDHRFRISEGYSYTIQGSTLLSKESMISLTIFTA